MAEYKEVYESLSKMLECNICMSHLSNPKVLHCQHSFCKDCLDDLLKFNEDGSAILSCPLRCEAVTYIAADKTTSDLNVNYQLKGIIEMYKEQLDKRKDEDAVVEYSCHECKQTVCIYCSDCHNFYCNTCQNPHKAHSTISIKFSETHNQFLPICKQHKALAKFVCCRKIICNYCQKRNHHLHPFETLKVHADRIKELFFNEDGIGKIEKMTENAKNNFEWTKLCITALKNSLAKQIKTRMFDYILHHVKLIELEEKLLLKELDGVIDCHLKAYPSITQSDVLQNVISKGDLELIAKKELILKEYSRFTTHLPTLSISLSKMSTSHPLGGLVVDHGDIVSISNNDMLASVTSKLPETTDVMNDVAMLVKKLKDLLADVSIVDSIHDGILQSSHSSEDLTSEQAGAGGDSQSDKSEEPGVAGYTSTVNRTMVDTSPSVTSGQTVTQALAQLDSEGYPYLDELFSNNKEELLMEMVKKRREVAVVRDTTGVTLLHSAAQWGFSNLMSLLLQSNLIEVNAFQRFHQTALHYAAYHNQPHCIRLLLRYKCDTELANHKGNTALDVAVQYKRGESILLLQNAGKK